MLLLPRTVQARSRHMSKHGESFLVWDEDEPEDVVEFYAFAPDDAARAFVEKRCSDDCELYETAESDGFDVVVHDPRNIKDYRFNVRGERTWTFVASGDV